VRWDAGTSKLASVASTWPMKASQSFDYGAALHILMKDIDLAIAQGEELGVPMGLSDGASGLQACDVRRRGR